MIWAEIKITSTHALFYCACAINVQFDNRTTLTTLTETRKATAHILTVDLVSYRLYHKMHSTLVSCEWLKEQLDSKNISIKVQDVESVLVLYSTTDFKLEEIALRPLFNVHYTKTINNFTNASKPDCPIDN